METKRLTTTSSSGPGNPIGNQYSNELIDEKLFSGDAIENRKRRPETN